MSRICTSQYFMKIAWLASARSTCPRRKVGAVLTYRNKIVATGYNGSLPGTPHCEDAGCLLAHDRPKPHCIRTIHAELNALLSRTGEADTLYCTDQSCLTCLKAAITLGVMRLYYCREYVDPDRDAFLDDNPHLIEVVQLTHIDFFAGDLGG